MKNNKKLHILVAYFLIYVVWGSTYYFIGVALNDFPPFLLGAIRFSVAGLLLLGWCLLQGEAVFKKSLIKKSAISGLILLFIDMAVIMLAQRYVTSSLVAIVASSTAIWILALDFPMWPKNFRNPFAVIGILIGFVGVAMLYIEQYMSQDALKYSERGMLILIFGCISWALGTLYTKYFSSGEESSYSFGGSAWQMLFASAMFWIFALVRKEPASVTIASVSAYSWFSLSYLIVFGSLMAFSAYIWLLKERPAAEVGTHAYVNPVVAILFGALLGKEHVTWIQITGLAIILISVSLVQLKLKPAISES